MEWDELRNTVYQLDGALRDIYVLDTNREDWSKWIAYVNSNYPVRWTVEDHNEDAPSAAIDAGFMAQWWDAERTSATAIISLDKVHVHCYFFTEVEIENDIAPREFHSLEDHQQLVDYLVAISTILGKEVILTDELVGVEPCDATVLIRVNGTNIQFG